LISVPPLVLGLEIRIWPTLSSSSTLSRSRRAIVPVSTNGVMVIPVSKPLEDVLSLDKVGELHEGDLSLLQGKLGVHDC